MGIPLAAAAILASALSAAVPQFGEPLIQTRSIGPIEIIEAKVLVARKTMKDRIYGEGVLVVAPLKDGAHAGFIINRPIAQTLRKLFPDDAASKAIKGVLFLGGPKGPEVVYAMVTGPKPKGSISFGSDLHVVMKGSDVDKVIATRKDEARYLRGTVVWAPGELSSELERGLWHVLDVNPAWLKREPRGLWQELVVFAENKENGI